MPIIRQKLHSSSEKILVQYGVLLKSLFPYTTAVRTIVRKVPIKNYPFACQLAMATVKTSAADVLVQTQVEKKKLSEIDVRRNFTFLLFGMAYLGGFQYWLLIHKYKAWFPSMKRFGNLSLRKKLKDTAGLMDAAKMVAFDVVIHAPIIYFPTYYTVKESIGGKKWNPLDWAKDGVSKYRRNMAEDLVAMAKVTVPSDCIQVVMPVHTRMLFRHLVSFFWTAYISFSRGEMEKELLVEEE